MTRRPTSYLFHPGTRLKPLAAALAGVVLTGLTVSASAGHDPIADAARLIGSAAAGWVREKPAQPAVVEPSAITRYTIVLKDAPVPSYHGGIAGYAEPPKIRTGRWAGRFDVNSSEANAYAGYLANKQTQFTRDLSHQLGRNIVALVKMQHAINAVIVELSDAEAELVRQRSDVEIVERETFYELDTDRGPTFIGANTIWDGSATGGVPSQGEGVIFGDIDTGINWQSPAFAAVGPIDGYAHVNPLGPGVYKGLCAAGADVGHCNSKLIGMYNMSTPTATATDTQGHGSHTASTVAGNHWVAPFAGGTFTISGVAPHANVIAYLACPSSCPTTATTNAVNQAVLDGVNVINFSIGGGTSPWTDTTSIAFRNAHNAGIFVSASAGNDGPGAGTTAHVEPWVETVAASTKDNVLAITFNLTGPGTPAPNTQSLKLRTGALPLATADIVNAPIVQSPNFANGSTDGCAAYPANTFTGPVIPGGAPADRIMADGLEAITLTGAIAVLNLDQNASSCASGVRRTAALTAGAIGVIFVDPAFINLGASGTSWSMLRAEWDQAYAQIQTSPFWARASILFPASSYPVQGDLIADFSSRGPVSVGTNGSTGAQYLVKPEITAPGVDILAAFSDNFGGPSTTSLDNGTSMSSPHTAGSAVLLRAVHPSWTPMQVKSALNLTAKTTNLLKANGQPSDLWDRGSGRVDLTAATRTGLILDETGANFLAARPSTGGNVATLNLAGMANFTCGASCSFTRTVTGTIAGSQTYTFSFTGLPAGSAAVSPPGGFTITGTVATQAITVTITGASLTPAVWNLGELVLTPTSGTLPVLHMPIAVRP